MKPWQEVVKLDEANEDVRQTSATPTPTSLSVAIDASATVAAEAAAYAEECEASESEPDFEEADGDSEEEYVPECILKERKKRGADAVQYFIKWQGWDLTDSTWEDAASIASCKAVLKAWQLQAKESRKKKTKGAQKQSKQTHNKKKNGKSKRKQT